MKFRVYLITGGIIIMGIVAFFSGLLPSASPKGPVAKSVYDFKINGLDGKVVDFEKYRGKKMLIVNTASKCGLTPQYKGLEKLHEQYSGQIAVLGFPANNFLRQERGSNEEIAAFCERNYGVRFQMFEKISVKGSDQHGLYQWLQSKTGKHPDWNFSKYLVSEDGSSVTFFKSTVHPMDKDFLAQVIE